ncbi:MAG: hypothetical protein GOV02_03540 [Candidatus Aenigmarchaeota archaeon]|nr:hypothetical protein [Candidatus Aenigmarchaeota archaeon]
MRNTIELGRKEFEFRYDEYDASKINLFSERKLSISDIYDSLTDFKLIFYPKPIILNIEIKQGLPKGVKSASLDRFIGIRSPVYLQTNSQLDLKKVEEDGYILSELARYGRKSDVYVIRKNNLFGKINAFIERSPPMSTPAIDYPNILRIQRDNKKSPSTRIDIIDKEGAAYAQKLIS